MACYCTPWAPLLALVAILGYARALQIITGTPSTFTTLYSQEHLVLALHNEASLLARPASSIIKPGSTARPMTDKEGKHYMCYMPPKGPQIEEETQVTTTAEDVLMQSDNKTPFELLERMTNLCLYRQEGLWTYEMCYKKSARQFRHGSGETKGEDFSCGDYTGDDLQVEEIKVDTASPADARLRYVTHNFTGGAPCALTGSGRTTEVRFTCQRDVRENVIVSVREFPTCNYIFMISTPFLCKHPEFKPPPDVLRTINCIPANAVPTTIPVPVAGGAGQEQTGALVTSGQEAASLQAGGVKVAEGVSTTCSIDDGTTSSWQCSIPDSSGTATGGSTDISAETRTTGEDVLDSQEQPPQDDVSEAAEATGTDRDEL